MPLLLVIIYIIIFIIMLLASLFYKINTILFEKYIIKKSNIYTKFANKEIEKLKMDNNIASDEHIRFLTKQLRTDKNLQSFDLMITNISKKGLKDVNNYIYSITEVFARIVRKFYHKSTIHQAYFAYIMAKYPINEEIDQKRIRQFLIYLCNSKSIYCRENAMLGLVKLGDVNAIIEALKCLSINGKLSQDKLLTESLINYTSDKDKLITSLWKNFDGFSYIIRVAIINYIRIINYDSAMQINSLLFNEDNEEIRYASLRYFGKFYYLDALNLIIKIGTDALEKESYGLAAVVSTVLKNYQTDASVNFLKKAITSSSWQVRENAAKTYIYYYGDDAIKYVDQLNDRYASDMLRYQLETNDLRDCEQVMLWK